MSSKVIIFGTHTQSWRDALEEDAKVWNLLPEIESVRVCAGDDVTTLQAPLEGNKNTVIIPLMEPHILKCPRIYKCLFPSRLAVETLANKAKFAGYASAEALTKFCPTVYSKEQAFFPCVVKRVDLNAGQGIFVVKSADSLTEVLKRDFTGVNSYIIQELIDSDYEYTTYAVSVGGSILWNSTYRFKIDKKNTIRTPINTSPAENVSVSKETLYQIQSFLEPLLYDGPVNVDYRFDEHGNLKILEINPRLGGSLMRPENVGDLAAALRAIVTNAK